MLLNLQWERDARRTAKALLAEGQHVFEHQGIAAKTMVVDVHEHRRPGDCSNDGYDRMLAAGKPESDDAAATA